MTATRNNVPPSSTLVMTVLVLRTSPSRKLCTARSLHSLPEHRAYTPRPAKYEKSPSTHPVNRGKKKKSRSAEERGRRRFVITAAMALYFVTMDIKSADPQLPVGSRTSCARPFSRPWRPSYP
jgi:hypothetical protein